MTAHPDDADQPEPRFEPFYEPQLRALLQTGQLDALADRGPAFQALVQAFRALRRSLLIGPLLFLLLVVQGLSVLVAVIVFVVLLVVG